MRKKLTKWAKEKEQTGVFLIDYDMNIFKSFTLKWWEAGIFKASLISLGIIIGSTWPEIFSPLRAALLVIFAVLTSYICWIWWKQ